MDASTESTIAKVFHQVIEGLIDWKPSDFPGLPEFFPQLEEGINDLIRCCVEDDELLEEVVELAGGVKPTEGMEPAERAEADAAFKKAILQYIENHEADEESLTTVIAIYRKGVSEMKEAAASTMMFNMIAGMVDDLDVNASAAADGDEIAASSEPDTAVVSVILSREREVLTSLTEEALRVTTTFNKGQSAEIDEAAVAAEICKLDDVVQEMMNAVKGTTLTPDMAPAERSKAVSAVLRVLITLGIAMGDESVKDATAWCSNTDAPPT